MEGLAGEKGEKVKIVTTEPDSHPKNFLSDMKVLTGGSRDIIHSRGGEKKQPSTILKLKRRCLFFKLHANQCNNPDGKSAIYMAVER